MVMTMITDATPMTTPISVRMVRILLPHRDCSASLKASRSGMILNVYDTHLRAVWFRRLGLSLRFTPIPGLSMVLRRPMREYAFQPALR